MTTFSRTHQSFPTGQAEGRHGVGKGGDIEPGVRLQHKLIQWPLEGVRGGGDSHGPFVAGAQPQAYPRGALTLA